MINAGALPVRWMTLQRRAFKRLSVEKLLNALTGMDEESPHIMKDEGMPVSFTLPSAKGRGKVRESLARLERKFPLRTSACDMPHR